jgi:hypothetical protein
MRFNSAKKAIKKIIPIIGIAQKSYFSKEYCTKTIQSILEDRVYKIIIIIHDKRTASYEIIAAEIRKLDSKEYDEELHQADNINPND